MYLIWSNPWVRLVLKSSESSRTFSIILGPKAAANIQPSSEKLIPCRGWLWKCLLVYSCCHDVIGSKYYKFN